VIRAAPAQDRRGRLHILGRGKRPIAGGGQDVAIRPALDQSFAERPFQRRDTPRHRRMIDGKRTSRAGKAAMARQRDENANILPIGTCANLLSH
jgi:hypothetical protein